MEVFGIRNIWKRVCDTPLIWPTIITTGWSTLGKAFGFLIPFFIAAWFGVSGETDAFFFAYGLILFLSGIVAPVVESVIVPYIAEARARGDDVGGFVGRVLSIGSVGLLAFEGAVLLVIKPILSAITCFDAQALNLVYRLIIETAPLVILLVWTGILSGALNSYKKFAFPAVSPAFRAIINLIIIYSFKNSLGVHAIALGYVIGEVARLFFLASVLRKLNLFKLRFSFHISSNLRGFFRTASYQVVGMAVVGLNPIVDKTMASWLSKGSVSDLYYAERLYMIPVNFITMGLMVTLLSHWSGRYYESGPKIFKRDIKKAIKVVGLLALIIMLMLILFHRPIVKLAFGRGLFTRDLLSEVGWIWVCYLFGLVPYLMGIVYFQALLVLKNTKILMRCGLYRCLLNIILNYILMKIFGTGGIALSTSLTSIFLLWFLHRNIFFREDYEQN